MNKDDNLQIVKDVLDNINPHIDNRIRKITLEYMEVIKSDFNKMFYKKVGEAFVWGIIGAYLVLYTIHILRKLF